MKEWKILMILVGLMLTFGFTKKLGAQETDFESRSSSRLFIPLFGPKVAFSEKDLVKIAENFDVSVGYLPTRDELNYIRAINPGFQALQYKASWTNSILRKDYSVARFEAALNEAMLYYRIGTLSKDLLPGDSIIEITALEGILATGTAHQDSLHTYSESGSVKYPFVLRVDNEIMKILEVSGNTAKVIRGIWGTAQDTHGIGDNVLSPTYVTNPNSTSPSFGYHLDPAHPVRWRALADQCMDDMGNRSADGIWIDILGSTTLRATRMDGVITHNYWNRKTGTLYTKSNFRKASERGVDFIQDTIFSVMGKYPVIWGNNMTAYTFMDGIHDRYKFLVPTEEKPRPIDGYCIEDAWGGYTPEQWIEFNEKGKLITPAKATLGDHNYRNWKMNLEEIMFCAQAGWSAAPQMINGGMKNYAFEFLEENEQSDWFRWAYASYLLAVEIPDSGKISTYQGITALRLRDEIREIVIDPCLQWKIGTPVVSHPPEQSDLYKINSRTYGRKFTNGIVLVNPHTHDDPDSIDLLSLGGPFIDPDTGDLVATLKMAAQSGKILLKEYDPKDYPDFNEMVIPYEGKPYFDRPFRVPGEDSIRMSWFDRGDSFIAIQDSDQWGSEAYLPEVRTDDLDEYPFVELNGDPPGIYYVSNGDTWRYSVDILTNGAYGVILHYQGNPSEPRLRSIRLSIYEQTTHKQIYTKTNTFQFGRDLLKPPQEYGGISLTEGSYIFEWTGLYTGAKPNLDYFKIYLLYPTNHFHPANVQIYPTLSRSSVYVESELPGRVHLFDMLGRVLLQQEILEPMETLDISSLSPGSYRILFTNSRARKSFFIYKPH